MRLKILLAAALLGNAPPGDLIIDGPPPEWTAKIAARYGMDITPDGKVWINADEHGVDADYSILAKDLYKASGQYRTVWVRGDHRRDKTVTYRKSMMRITFNCKADSYSLQNRYTYGPDGSIISSTTGGAFQYDPVIPGTFGESWFNYVCSSLAGAGN